MELSKIIDGMLLLIDGILTIGKFHIYIYINIYIYIYVSNIYLYIYTYIYKTYIYIYISETYIYIYLNLKQNQKDFCVDESGTIMFARTRNTRIKRKKKEFPVLYDKRVKT